MGGIQTKIYSKLKYLIVGLFFVPAIVFSALLIPPSTVNAACPAGEYAGAADKPNGATDPKKCYKDTTERGQTTATATNNTPDGNGTGNQTGQDGEADNEGTTCAVEKIGWILCPIMEGSAKMADWAFYFLANAFLEIEPELLTSNPDNGKGTITAWEQARNLANIMFVIAFIIIIYSQMTGAGLNNYGIKRMLPRLIIAAIAVNISYYICQAMVDISNLLGFNIMDALRQIAKEIGPQVMGENANGGIDADTASTGGWIATIAITLLAVGGLVWLFLPVLGSIVIFILITCVMVILILLLRKAFIVLLVVASPLAFVMYLLPNTEKYFDKWLSMFWKLLMVFPVVALLLGGGQLASTIILVAGSQPAQEGQVIDCKDVNNNTGDENADKPSTSAEDPNRIQKDSYGIDGECAQEISMPDGSKRQSGMMLGLVAAGVAVAPLLAVWSVLQGAISAAGAIGGKIGGAINNMNGGSRSRMKKGLDETKADIGDRMALRAMQKPDGFANRATGGTYRRRALREGRRGNVKSELKRQSEDTIAKEIRDNADYRNKMAGGGGLLGKADPNALQRTMDRAQLTIEKVQAEEVDAAEARIANLSSDDLTKLIKGEAVANVGQGGNLQKAAIQKAVRNTDVKGMEQAIKSAGSAEDRAFVAKAIEKNYSAVKSKGAHLVDKTMLSNLRSGEGGSGQNGQYTDNDLDNAAERAMQSMAPELLASQQVPSLSRIQGVASNRPNSSGAAGIRASAAALQSPDNATVYSKVGTDGRGIISSL